MSEQVRAALEAKAAQVKEQMTSLSRPVEDQGSISFGKRVGDGTAMAVDRLTSVSAHDNLGTILQQVRHALDRLDEGGYGVCEVCGEAIPEGRLEARPWATRCIRHTD
ncbi:MAG: TraR/DksA C4-type zinc finger protein [Ornithinimicrobium sp.]|uniref:TraR/DksA family transcriptional regulator n=1 Tax=Ornithinimicrobium sp. TaxID=1977084 RepID=UPI0026DF64D5|nr:TraR/DksA C4-type zinc finger protein [Ornithinimicrobium sp.]MDO5739595.1 TraR/DksA C4-type zinc finger protein [Ornithinimicrobium sp.]